jgi:hypothetical protein
MQVHWVRQEFRCSSFCHLPKCLLPEKSDIAPTPWAPTAGAASTPPEPPQPMKDSLSLTSLEDTFAPAKRTSAPATIHWYVVIGGELTLQATVSGGFKTPHLKACDDRAGAEGVLCHSDRQPGLRRRLLQIKRLGAVRRPRSPARPPCARRWRSARSRQCSQSPTAMFSAA